MGRGQHIGQAQQRLALRRGRLCVEHVERCTPGGVGGEFSIKGAWLDKLRPTDVDQQGVGLHPREIGAGHTATGCLVQAQMQREDVGVTKEGLLVGGAGMAIPLGLLAVMLVCVAISCIPMLRKSPRSLSELR